MENRNKTSLFTGEIVMQAIKDSFIKLNPAVLVKNPVIFIVGIGAVMTTVVVIADIFSGHFSGFNFQIMLWLWFTVLFANFAEAIAEARGKAQADSLRKTREETPAKKIPALGKINSHDIELVSSSQLKKEDLFFCEAGDIIPTDGEIVEGLATIDESAITGESAPVIREAGGDKSSVTGGTKVLSDRITVRVSTEPGESFLDKMIALVE